MDKLSKTPQKLLWKPPSCEDFGSSGQVAKRIKLDPQVTQASCLVGSLEPKNVEDLTTHTKKIQEVKNWLKEVVGDTRARMLLLVGPSGSGKTATFRVVAHDLKLQVCEWITPVDKQSYKRDIDHHDPYDKHTYLDDSQVDKFEDFIFRMSRYNSLLSNCQRNIILIEDFPNIFIWDPSSFHKFLNRYQSRGKSPIVFICTEESSLNLHNQLFPAHVKSSFNIHTIKFNPVTKTALMKVMCSVMDKQKKLQVSKDTLENIALCSNGDVRSALSGLQVLLVGLKPVKFTKQTSRNKKISDVTNLSVKDTHAEFYQNIGRVLYPKRREDKSEEVTNRQFVHDVQVIAENFSNVVFSLLHENYLRIFTKMADMTLAAECFSDADTFSADSELKEYLALTTVIGLMSANTQSKKGSFQPLKRSGLSSTIPTDKRVQFAEFGLTNRQLHLDVIPYVKNMPQFHSKMDEYTADRLLHGVTEIKPSKPQPVKLTLTDANTSDMEDDLTIEVDDD